MVGAVGIDAKGTHSAQLSRVEGDGFTVRPSAVLEYTPKLARSAGIDAKGTHRALHKTD